MALSPTLNRALTATASIVTTELFNEGKSAANNPAEYPFARIIEKLDGRQCPLCAAVHGKILAVGSKEYAEWRQPSHINCRRVLSYISKDVGGTEATFQRPSAELIQKHGHYHIDPVKHVEFRVPAEPAGRNFIVRRVKDPQTGEVKTVLDWAPWWKQVPQAKRDLVLQARATADEAEFRRILERLGLVNLEDAETLRQATLLGLKDRVEGYLSEFPGPPWKNPNQLGFAVAQDQWEAEGIARKTIPGLKDVDYSGLDTDVANEFNRVFGDIATKFGIEIPAILPKDSPLWPTRLLSNAPIFVTKYGVAYRPEYFQGAQKQAFLAALLRDRKDTGANATLAALLAHEGGHLLHVMHPDPVAARTTVVRFVRAYFQRLGDVAVRKELGNHAADHGDEECWSDAFSAYWDEIWTCNPDTKELVRDILKALYPHVPPDEL